MIICQKTAKYFKSICISSHIIKCSNGLPLDMTILDVTICATLVTNRYSRLPQRLVRLITYGLVFACAMGGN